MKNPDRIDPIIETIKLVWKVNPGLRLGQLLGNVAPGEDLYYMEDKKLVEELIKFYSGRKK